MNSDVIQGQWKQLKGAVKQQWGKLTDDDIAMIEGSRDKLIGAIQERYGHSRHQVERELQRFEEAIG